MSSNFYASLTDISRLCETAHMDTIKAIREALGWTPHEMAQHLSVTYQTVINYEAGTRTPRLDLAWELLRLAKRHKMKYRGRQIGLEQILPEPKL